MRGHELIAVYKGDNLLMTGKARECAKRLGYKIDSLSWYLTPTYKKRVAKRSYSNNAMKVIKL